MEALIIFKTTLNIICNLITFLMIVQYLQGIGSREDIVQRTPALQGYSLRFGLTLVASGAVLQAAYFYNPHVTTLMINIGVCAFVLWANKYLVPRLVRI